MNQQTRHDLCAVGAQFQLPGRFLEAAAYGTGHINDTYAAVYEESGQRVRYIHQRINHNVFKQPVPLMENVRRVTEHQRRKLAARGAGDLDRRALTLVPARDGACWHRDAEGSLWRTYLFIEGAKTYDVIESEAQAHEAAAAFGEFQRQLADLPGGRLSETIPDFHNTPSRFAAFERALAADGAGRAKDCRPEIDFCLTRRDWVGHLVEAHRRGEIPERVTHNDCKLNNVMLDDVTGSGICVIDLDTVMPGLVHYDFGDMVRTSTSPAKEDERDLAKVTMRMSYFEALARGYLSTAGSFLTPAEKHELPFAGKLITFEIGIRFLTDFLAGDVYFKVHRPGHNLDRCRTQFRLVESIEAQEAAMQRVVDGL